MALLADQRGDEEEAAILYSEAVAKKPDWEEAWFRLGYIQLHQGDYPASIEAFTECLKKRSDWADAQLNLGLAYWWSGERESARASLEKAYSAQPSSLEVLRSLTALTVELNDLKKALDYQTKLNKLGDRSAELSYNLGIALQEANRFEEAAKAYREALSINPSFAEAHLNLGHALKELGQDEEAKASWEQAISEPNPNSPTTISNP